MRARWISVWILEVARMRMTAFGLNPGCWRRLLSLLVPCEVLLLYFAVEQAAPGRQGSGFHVEISCWRAASERAA